MRPMDNADREFFDSQFKAIALRMEEIGLIRGNNWGVTTEKGRYYHFRCDRSYAKRGSVAEAEEKHAAVE